MSYWSIKNSIGNNSRIHDSGFKSSVDASGNSSFSEFYEIEEAVVLDVIYDTEHPEIKNLVSDSWPDNYKDEPAKSEDKNYTYIGRVKFRLLNSQIGVPKEKLSWAKPLYSTGIVEYPLLNEIVLIAKYRSEWYYIKKLNINGFVNNNANFNVEKTEGNTGGNRADDLSNKNKNLPLVNPSDKSSPPVSYTGPKNVKNSNNKGFLGYYFRANNKIRTLKKYEGDLTIESRHGQSIRFSSYDNLRKNDIGDSKNPDYNGCGNPMILIRNKQRPLGDEKKDRQLHPLLNPITKISDIEKNVGGIIEEDINNDGSSIQITSGLTETKWKTTVYKSIFSSTFQEEQKKYSPSNSTSFKYPVLNGDQIVIQTDRLIFSTRFGEFLNYSKKRYSVITDSEYTVDADDQIVITSNNKTVINSPAIYLGEYNNTNEPAVLGQTAVNWLYDLCEWIKNHTHWYDHSHPDAGGAEPNKTQKPVELVELEKLQNVLHTILSRRVFLTGGGFAPGADGVSPKNTDSVSKPTQINVFSGKGVPGGFFGANRRK